MIEEKKGYIILNTGNLTYAMHVNDAGYVLTDYFGDYTDITENGVLGLKEACPKGCATLADSSVQNFSPDNCLSEMSFALKGDYKEPGIILKSRSRGYTYDFRFSGLNIRPFVNDTKNNDLFIPDYMDIKDELVITLKEKELDLIIELHYYVPDKSDVILRSTSVINNTDETITIEKISSLQFDTVNDNYSAAALGLPFNEDELNICTLTPGIFKPECTGGDGKLIIRSGKCRSDYGRCYGMAMSNTESPEYTIELTSYDHLHILAGTDSLFFHRQLKKGESYASPPAAISYSSKGTDLLAERMQALKIKSIAFPENAAGMSNIKGDL